MRKWMVWGLIVIGLVIGLAVPAFAQEPGIRTIPVTGQLFDSRLSPDGGTLAIFENAVFYDEFDSRFTPIRLIDLATGNETLLDAGDYAGDVVWTSDGATLVSAHMNGLIVVWDVATATEQQRFWTPPGGKLLALLPDERTLIGSLSGNIPQFGRWDLETGAMTAYYGHRYENYNAFMDMFMEGPPENTASFVLLPGGDQMAEVTSFGNIWLWDLTTGSVRLWYDTEETRPYFYVRHLALMPDGESLLYYHRDENVAYALDLDSGIRTVVLEMESPNAPALSPDGSLLAWLDSPTGAIHVWDIETGGSMAEIALPDRLTMGRGHFRPTLHFTPDGSQLVFAGYTNLDSDQNMVLVIDLP